MNLVDRASGRREAIAQALVKQGVDPATAAQVAEHLAIGGRV